MARKNRKSPSSRITVPMEVFLRLQKLAAKRKSDIPRVIGLLVDEALGSSESHPQPDSPPVEAQPAVTAVAPSPTHLYSPRAAEAPVVVPPAPSARPSVEPPLPPPVVEPARKVPEAPPPFMEKGSPSSRHVPPGAPARSGMAKTLGPVETKVSPGSPAMSKPVNVAPPSPRRPSGHPAEPPSPALLAQIRELEDRLRDLTLLIEDAPREKRDELALTYAEVTAALDDLRRLAR